MTPPVLGSSFAARLQDADSTVVDTLARSATPSATAQGLDAIMTADGKIWVVVAVILIIWFGLLFFLFRTDRKLDDLERKVESEISHNDPSSQDHKASPHPSPTDS